MSSVPRARCARSAWRGRELKIGMMNLAYNMRRLCCLERAEGVLSDGRVAAWEPLVQGSGHLAVDRGGKSQYAAVIPPCHDLLWGKSAFFRMNRKYEVPLVYVNQDI